MMKLALLLSLSTLSSAFLLSPSPALSGSRTLAPATHSLSLCSASARIRPALRSGRGAALLVRAQGAATEGAVTEKGTVGIIGVTGGVGRLTAAAVMAQGFKAPPDPEFLGVHLLSCETLVSDSWRTHDFTTARGSASHARGEFCCSPKRLESPDLSDSDRALHHARGLNDYQPPCGRELSTQGHALVHCAPSHPSEKPDAPRGQVRAIVRDAGRARPLLPSGIEIVEADVRFPEEGVGLARAIQVARPHHTESVERVRGECQESVKRVSGECQERVSRE
jgi:hypothetical protein